MKGQSEGLIYLYHTELHAELSELFHLAEGEAGSKVISKGELGVQV